MKFTWILGLNWLIEMWSVTKKHCSWYSEGRRHSHVLYMRYYGVCSWHAPLARKFVYRYSTQGKQVPWPWNLQCGYLLFFTFSANQFAHQSLSFVWRLLPLHIRPLYIDNSLEGNIMYYAYLLSALDTDNANEFSSIILYYLHILCLS